MTFLRLAYRLQIVFVLLLIVYIGLVLIPLNWFWYAPGNFAIADTRSGVPAKIKYDRNIMVDVDLSYTVVVRSVVDFIPVCDPTVGPFPYTSRTKAKADPDMLWWAGNDRRCVDVPPGDYIIQTKWTAAGLFWGLLPPKSAETPPVRYTVY